LLSLIKIKGEVVKVFDGSACSTRDDDLPSPLPIACTDSDSAWFEKFVNDECDFVNATDVAHYQEMEESASAQERWKLSARYFEKKQEAAKQALAYEKCLSDNGASVGSAKGIYCTCRLAINKRVTAYNEPIAHTALVLTFLEVLCIVCAICVMRAGAKTQSASKKIDKLAAQDKQEILDKKKSSKGGMGKFVV
jgi:hypothetical protein